MTHFIAVSNRRGGVGKTTTTTMLAYGLAVVGRQRVLVIDLDAQASSSMVLMGYDRFHEAKRTADPHGMAGCTVASLLMAMFGEGPADAAPYISRGVGDVLLPDGKRPHLDIIPSSYDLDDREIEIMISRAGRHGDMRRLFDHVERRVGEILRSASGGYDYVVVDCPPGLSHIVWGALRIADFVVIPYIPDKIAEDYVGWLVKRLTQLGRGSRWKTLPNRVRDGAGTIGESFPGIGVQLPNAVSLARALDYRETPTSLREKFGDGSKHVQALVSAVLAWVETAGVKA